jgi:hypothetical protein
MNTRPAPYQPLSQKNPNPADFDGDLSGDVNFPVPGWPLLAKLIAENPNLEAFPTFRDLSIKSLLYYQAELIYLRKELHKAEWQDFRQLEDEDEDEEEPSAFAENLWMFISAKERALNGGGEMPKQWAIIERIRTTLDKYSKLFSKIFDREIPNSVFSQRCYTLANPKDCRV